MGSGVSNVWVGKVMGRYLAVSLASSCWVSRTLWVLMSSEVLTDTEVFLKTIAMIGERFIGASAVARKEWQAAYYTYTVYVIYVQQSL